jgi:Na+/H+-translocating membrane pyrophosphatase
MRDASRAHRSRFCRVRLSAKVFGFDPGFATIVTYAAKGARMSEISSDSLEEARRYVRRKRIFFAVLAVWLALTLMWFLIDLSDDSSSWWFYWPMLGTGIAVAISGIVLVGMGGLFGADWERREIEKYLRSRGKKPVG